jgi:hypothetical protein
LLGIFGNDRTEADMKYPRIREYESNPGLGADALTTLGRDMLKLR